jgi:hypothetical protein
MAERRRLRSVDSVPAPEPKRPARSRVVKPKSVKDAASKGTPRELLVAMRDRIAEELDSRATLARDLASLSKRLMELQREIQAIDAREEQESSGRVVPDESFDASAV